MVKKARFKKKQLILFIVNALLIIGVVICLIIYKSTASALNTQDAANAGQEQAS